MDPTDSGSLATTLAIAGHGILPLLLQFVLTLALLVVGIGVYTLVTPFREWALVRDGNVAAATLLGGAIVSLAIPLAALLATTGRSLEILVWGLVAIVLQLATFLVAYRMLRGMGGRIEAGSVAAAIPLVAAQLAVALLNAAAMVPV